MSRHLFLFTIGPVQTFISQARKTQDLYSGSKLLSNLIDNAMDEVASSGLLSPGGFIFPDQKTESKPNRFIAILQTNDPDKIGKQIENAVKDKYRSLAATVLKKNGIAKPTNFDMHVDNFLEIYWVFLPYTDDYSGKYEETERLLCAVKNIRAFAQLPEAGRKCILCGERNVLFYKPSGPNDKKADIHKAVDIPKFKYVFTSGEGLCAICTVKRFYEKETFPSTAKISLMHTLYRMRQYPEGHVLLDKYMNIFKESHFEAQLYYEENLTQEYLKKHDFDEFVDKVPKLQCRQKKIEKFAKKKNLKLSKYYAVLVFDGDSMGRWLSGEALKDDNLEQFHFRLSELLGKFAEFSKNCLKNPLDNQNICYEHSFFGKAVYAGGDDFLGFVNLNHLFYVLKKLREEFDKQISIPLLKDFEFQNSDERITFSAGLAIAHYKTPLSDALEWARAMLEKKAKKVDKKDAVGFALLRHSGNIGETVFRWKHQDFATDLATDLCAALKNWISNKFLYSLRQELLNLFDKDTGIEPDIVEAELYRLMIRRKTDANVSKTQVEDLAKRLACFFDQLENLGLPVTESFNQLTNFFGFLEICNFVAKETNDDMS